MCPNTDIQGQYSKTTKYQTQMHAHTVVEGHAPVVPNITQDNSPACGGVGGVEDGCILTAC